MNITTYKKDGSGVATPVWFVDHDGKIFMMTDAASWKIKRIKNNSNVLLAPSTYSGEETGERVAGVAKLLDQETGEDARRYLVKKYKLQFHFFYLMGRLRKAENVFIEVSPE